VPGDVIGKLVMEGLREIDEVAYVRFASVYRRFQEATDFVQEVKKLEAKQ
jgi:transcriptional repressor NrdR